ncbi:MAG: glycosyltransferase [Acidobacteriaceae bacterium]|nr:glycosyltransferase [Acidobacteriaceae bacterium]
MKIAHVVDSMEMGGAEMLVLQMCRLQREQGCDPRVYAIASLGALGEQMQAEGFSVQANLGLHLSDSVRKFSRIFKSSPPDVVHIHNPTPTIYASMAARMAEVPCVVSTRHSLIGPPHKIVAELKYAVAASFCDWIVGICDATVENLKSLHTVPARKIIRVYNGAAPLKRSLEGAQPSKSGFTLVYVGRLEPVKNHPLLLHAFCSALKAMPCLRLWMVGDGSARKALETLASELGIVEQVTFWGQQLDVAPFFSAADAFTMSSKSEGLPMSLLQAFSLGLPTIVTDVGGMAEVVKSAEAGVIVSPTDSREMTEAILRLATNREEHEKFSENALSSFHARFSLQTMVAAYMELYQNTPRALSRAKR